MAAAADCGHSRRSRTRRTNEKPEAAEPGGDDPADEEYWLKRAPATLDAAKQLQGIVATVYGPTEIRFVRNYISIIVRGKIWNWLHDRAHDKSLVWFWFAEPYLSSALEELKVSKLDYRQRSVPKAGEIRIDMRVDEIAANRELLVRLAELEKQSWAAEK